MLTTYITSQGLSRIFYERNMIPIAYFLYSFDAHWEAKSVHWHAGNNTLSCFLMNAVACLINACIFKKVFFKRNRRKSQRGLIHIYKYRRSAGVSYSIGSRYKR